jgi:uncharacterized FlgJ-related protein
MISKQDEYTTRNKNYRSVSLMKPDTEILNKTLLNGIQYHIKKIIHHDDYVEFVSRIQGCFHIHRLINMIHLISRMTQKIYGHFN